MALFFVRNRNFSYSYWFISNVKQSINIILLTLNWFLQLIWNDSIKRYKIIWALFYYSERKRKTKQIDLSIKYVNKTTATKRINDLIKYHLLNKLSIILKVYFDIYKCEKNQISKVEIVRLE